MMGEKYCPFQVAGWYANDNDLTHVETNCSKTCALWLELGNESGCAFAVLALNLRELVKKEG